MSVAKLSILRSSVLIFLTHSTAIKEQLRKINRIQINDSFLCVVQPVAQSSDYTEQYTEFPSPLARFSLTVGGITQVL